MIYVINENNPSQYKILTKKECFKYNFTKYTKHGKDIFCTIDNPNKINKTWIKATPSKTNKFIKQLELKPKKENLFNKILQFINISKQR